MKSRLNRGLTNGIKRGIMRVEGTFHKLFAKAEILFKSFTGSCLISDKPRSGNTEHSARRAKEPIMNKFMSRALGALAVSATLALVACGGGGGGGTTVTPPPPTPATGVFTSVTGCFADDGTAHCNATVAYSIENATSPSLTAGNVRISTLASDTATFAIPVGTTTLRLLDGSSTLKTGSVLATCKEGSAVPAGGVLCTKTAAAYWNPKPAFVAEGVKVTAPNQLPAGCTSASQQCWKDAVMNGTVKLVATSATMVGINSRPIVFAYYKTADGLRWNTLPLYADTGELTGSEINGGGTFNIDMVVGNTPGVVFRVGTSCFQQEWFKAGDPSGNSNVWATASAACPA